MGRVDAAPTTPINTVQAPQETAALNTTSECHTQ